MERTMSDQSNTIATQSTGLAKSAFARAMAKRERMGRATFIACDGSGSMDSSTDNPGEKRIDALRGVVYGLKAENKNFRTIIFETNVYESDIIPEPTGGTNMAAMFDYAREQDAAHLIVISDGQPDNAEFALRAAQRLVEHGCKRIDVFYVGPTGAWAEGATKFMNDLAALTGANVGAVRFDDLENKVRLALTAGTGASPDDAPREPFAL